MRLVRVDTFPMGASTWIKFASAAADPETEQEAKELTGNTLAGLKLILSVDRLDYSKGILNRLEGYELFLESNPAYHRQGRSAHGRRAFAHRRRAVRSDEAPPRSKN